MKKIGNDRTFILHEPANTPHLIGSWIHWVAYMDYTHNWTTADKLLGLFSNVAYILYHYRHPCIYVYGWTNFRTKHKMRKDSKRLHSCRCNNGKNASSIAREASLFDLPIYLIAKLLKNHRYFEFTLWCWHCPNRISSYFTPIVIRFIITSSLNCYLLHG
jgi:hypothetical protein